MLTTYEIYGLVNVRWIRLLTKVPVHLPSVERCLRWLYRSSGCVSTQASHTFLRDPYHICAYLRKVFPWFAQLEDHGNVISHLELSFGSILISWVQFPNFCFIIFSYDEIVLVDLCVANLSSLALMNKLELAGTIVKQHWIRTLISSCIMFLVLALTHIVPSIVYMHSLVEFLLSNLWGCSIYIFNPVLRVGICSLHSSDKASMTYWQLMPIRQVVVIFTNGLND